MAIPVWWLVSRFFKLLPHLRRRPQEVWILPVYVLLGFVIGVIKIFALVTLNRQGWLTRERPTPTRSKLALVLSSAASYLATVAVVYLLFLGFLLTIGW